MAAPARTLVLVELLAGDADARRAAISWPLVPPGLRGLALLRSWAHCSGIPMARLDSRADMLQRHGICRPDRTVEPEALRVIEHLAADTMRRGRRS